jgi:hypothetical protein
VRREEPAEAIDALFRMAHQSVELAGQHWMMHV